MYTSTLKTVLLIAVLMISSISTEAFAQKRKKMPTEEVPRIELLTVDDAIIAYYLTGIVEGTALVNPSDLKEGTEVTLKEGRIMSDAFSGWVANPGAIKIKFIDELAEPDVIFVTLSSVARGDSENERVEELSFTVEHIHEAR